jgi:predicted helicase
LQVFLTNTLEPIEPQANFLLPAVAAEVAAAQKVKDREILVIVGNPPYSGHSKNKGAWITAEISAYREGFPELAKPAQGKWLQDDYVKFIRFAQLKMDRVKEGVVGVITNHSWLDNPTFKGMRNSLMQTFNQVYVLDLHGNTKKKERTQTGGHDENVFDIEQGVSIALFTKGLGLEDGVWHFDLWGSRISKYKALAENALTLMQWQRLHPSAPDWIFRSRDLLLARHYREFWSIPDIYRPMGDPAPGIVTTHDEFAISFTREEALDKVRSLLSTADEKDARRRFRLCSQSQWSYETAKAELPTINIRSLLIRLDYRPFDARWTIWNKNVAVHRRERVMCHLLVENVALTTSRQSGVIGAAEFDAVTVVNRPVDFNYYRRGGEYVFPIYLTATDVGQDSAVQRENLSSEFREFIDSEYEHHYTPEEILGYVYAVLHAPTYRTRYAEFLRTEFPRVPFPDAGNDFEALSELGWALIQAHLLRELPCRGLAAYHGRGDHTVEAVRYAPGEQAIAINKTQSFNPVPQAVWDFHIGGYQVLDKYLKSRRGRELSLDEIEHVGTIADSLAFTIDQMARIDKAYRLAFPQQT